MSQTSQAKMICPDCRIACRRFGKHRNGLRRFRCAECGTTYTEAHAKPLADMTIPLETAILALKLLIEGSSIRTVERITELHRDTIMRLLVLAGEKCATLIGKRIKNLEPRDVECDELWGYIKKKEGHKGVKEEDDESIGDSYCFVAIERNTKLVMNIALGRRNQKTTDVFIEGLRDSIKPGHHFQITTDGFAPYVSAIQTTFGEQVDFAQLIKVYKAGTEGEARYSPATVESVKIVPLIGDPDPKRICTSIVERQNLTIRMQMRRLTRLTNAFSKKFENLWAAYCLHFAYYNFCRIHKSLRVTPAMESNLTDHVWTIEELLTNLGSEAGRRVGGSIMTASKRD
jgi:transposase-like protein/IS1 family transposase